MNGNQRDRSVICELIEQLGGGVDSLLNWSDTIVFCYSALKVCVQESTMVSMLRKAKYK